MDMKDRERAELPTNVQTVEPTAEDLDLMQVCSEISTALTQIRGFQVDKEDALNRKIEQFILNARKAEDERTQLANDTGQYILGLQETIKAQNGELRKGITAIQNYLATKEKELTQTVAEVKSLKTELLRGFLDLNQKNKVPLTHRLYMVATVAGASVMGGLIVFLVMYLLLWPHGPTVKPHSTH